MGTDVWACIHMEISLESSLNQQSDAALVTFRGGKCFSTHYNVWHWKVGGGRGRQVMLIQSTLPKSNLLGLFRNSFGTINELMSEMYFEVIRLVTILLGIDVWACIHMEISLESSLNQDLRLRRLFDLCEFDLGKFANILLLVTVAYLYLYWFCNALN